VRVRIEPTPLISPAQRGRWRQFPPLPYTGIWLAWSAQVQAHPQAFSRCAHRRDSPRRNVDDSGSLTPPRTRRVSQKHDPHPHGGRRRSRGDPFLPSPPRPRSTPPQRSHFGKPAQAYSDEALAWLKEQIHGRRLKCQLFQRDHYGRIVALPLLPHHRWWPRRSATRNLSLEMVRAGWGTAYTGVGAKYGGWGQAAFLEAQAEAQYVFMSVRARDDV
jgi:hypothetical protein